MPTVREAFADFQLANRADGLSEKTLTFYAWMLADSTHSLLHWLPQRGHEAFTSLSRNDLRTYIVWVRGRKHERTGEPLAAQTVDDYIRAVHRFAKWASEEYDVGNPARGIRYPKHKPVGEPRAISLEDAGKMLRSCNPATLKGLRDRALIALLIDTGIRAGGVVGLKVGDVDLAHRTAVVTEKGQKSRMVVFSLRTAKWLGEWMRERPRELARGPVFYNIRTREPLTVNGLRQTLRKRADALGVIHAHTHGFRHGFARAYYNASKDLLRLSYFLGHESVETTVKYYAVYTRKEHFKHHEFNSPVNRIVAWRFHDAA